MVLSLETGDGYVMESGFSYHTCQIKEYCETLKLEKDGVFHLGDNKTCKIHGIDTIRLKMFDGREFLLHNVRYVPEFRISVYCNAMSKEIFFIF